MRSTPKANPEAVRLLNKRLILAIIQFCTQKRGLAANQEEFNAYSYMSQDTIPSQLIAYLESPEANALTLPDDVMKKLNEKLEAQSPMGTKKTIIDVITSVKNYLNMSIELLQIDTLGTDNDKLHEYLLRQARVTVDAKRSLSSSVIPTLENPKSGVSSIKAQENVNACLTKWHVTGVRVRQYDKDVAFDNFTKELTSELQKDPPIFVAYTKLMSVMGFVQKFAAKINIILAASITPEEKAKNIDKERLHLHNNIETFNLGPIGACIDDKKMIADKNLYKDLAKKIDFDTLYAIYAYSKHLAIEVECKTIDDPALARQLTDINTAIANNNYGCAIFFSTNTSGYSSDTKSGYKNDNLILMDESKVNSVLALSLFTQAETLARNKAKQEKKDYASDQLADELYKILLPILSNLDLKKNYDKICDIINDWDPGTAEPAVFQNFALLQQVMNGILLNELNPNKKIAPPRPTKTTPGDNPSTITKPGPAKTLVPMIGSSASTSPSLPQTTTASTAQNDLAQLQDDNKTLNEELAFLKNAAEQATLAYQGVSDPTRRGSYTEKIIKQTKEIMEAAIAHRDRAQAALDQNIQAIQTKQQEITSLPVSTQSQPSTSSSRSSTTQMPQVLFNASSSASSSEPPKKGTPLRPSAPAPSTPDKNTQGNKQLPNPTGKQQQ